MSKKTRRNKANDWLINYIPEPIRISGVGGFKGNILSLLKTNTPTQAVYVKGKKLRKPKVTLETITLITLEVLL